MEICLPVADSPELKSFSSEIKSVPKDWIVPNITHCTKHEAKHTTHAQPASTWYRQHLVLPGTILSSGQIIGLLTAGQ